MSLADATLIEGEIFISHSREDVVAARELRAHLESSGYRCWMAPDDIKGPQTWAEQIVAAIHRARVIVVLVSEHSNASQHVSREVDLAVERGIPLLPVRVQNVTPAGALDYLLRLAQWVDAFPGAMVDHAEDVRSSLDALVERRVAAPPPPASPPPAAMDVPGSRAAGWGWKAGVAVLVAAVAAVAIFLLVDGGDDPGDVPAGSVVVPDVDGFDRESAIGVMRGAGFADTEIFWRFGCYGFAGEREGLAVRQTPSPGEVVPTQTRVDILLQANDCAPVPDVVGEESAAAAGAVAAAGLVPEIRDECGSPAAAGTVASQQPSPGTEVVEGTVLVLVVEGDC